MKRPKFTHAGRILERHTTREESPLPLPHSEKVPETFLQQTESLLAEAFKGIERFKGKHKNPTFITHIVESDKMLANGKAADDSETLVFLPEVRAVQHTSFAGAKQVTYTEAKTVADALTMYAESSTARPFGLCELLYLRSLPREEMLTIMKATGNPANDSLVGNVHFPEIRVRMGGVWFTLYVFHHTQLGRCAVSVSRLGKFWNKEDSIFFNTQH